MHSLPRVRELAERFSDSLTVIGVHAGKFAGERRTARIAAAADRLGVEHAIVNDRQFRVWRDYAVTSWPTIALIDPEGYLAGVQPGEFDVDQVSEAIGAVLEAARERGSLVRGPDPVAVDIPRGGSTLRYPGRVLVDGTRLWVADTGHGRVLECALDASSGRAEVSRVHEGFAEPQGLVSRGDSLFVADRSDHSVWELSPHGRRRVAGTGRLGAYRIAPGVATQADLRSPWGLAPYADGIAVAMAGTHQLWKLDPDTGRLSLLAGAGGEDLVDGPAPTALLAQPTGVAAAGDVLAFSDAESSAVRTLGDGAVNTVVGTGLFDFGDRDGTGDEVLLQHAEDLAWHDGVLAVTDTYNDRLKRIDPLARSASPWMREAGEAGALCEPAGVSSDGTTLVVADTGNHRVVLVRGDGALREVDFT